ncbi:PorT family protein [Pontibacter sp. 172403-2]|uniref:porin family protein n=1 Tax=Pontibacter rufus TaxID=2791028 RepID=UPI0018AFE932|nr:porin family protein [Pontibacter sp. 172403-2]MBF9255190.1 PorT family protein [Pontibacter sp. 172403-2]
MKKLILLLFLILVPLLAVQAQYLRFGGKAGGGFSKAAGDGSDQMQHLAGMQAGLLLSYEFVSRLAVQAELNYNQKGFTYSEYAADASSDEYLSGDMRLHYLELPLLLKIQKGGLFAEAGPYVGYLLNKDSDVHRFSSSGIVPEPVDLGPEPVSINDFNRWDYGYAAGIGLIMDNGFFLSIRNTGGFRSFSKALDQKNQVWQISVGFLMPPPRPASLM